MTITRGYDAADRLTTITYPLQGSNGPNTPGGGQVITRTFTPRNQLASVTMDPDGSGPAAATSVADFTYNPGMRETHRGLGNGLARDTTYGRADNLVTAMTVQEDVAVNPAQRPGLSWSYTYDANKNLETATTGGLMSNYSFTIEQDDADRLSKWLRPNGELSEWALSLVGDWKTYSGSKLVGNTTVPFSQDRTHNPVHEIKTIDSAGAASAALFYDPKGNLTTDEDGQTYTYDFDNQLREVKDPNGNPLGTYEYDALGRRVTKQLYAPGSAATTSRIAFMWLTDPGSGLWQLLAEYEQNTLARTYTYGEYVDEPLTLTVHGVSANAGTYWYHRDGQYNIIGLTDGSGTVVERYAYTPYGERRIFAPDGTTPRQVSAAGNTHGHQGLWHDDESGLVYNRARYRMALLGRWLSIDPQDYIDSFNLYQYLQSLPLMKSDPSGEQDHSRTNRRRRGREYAGPSLSWTLGVAGYIQTPLILSMPPLPGAYARVQTEVTEGKCCKDGVERNYVIKSVSLEVGVYWGLMVPRADISVPLRENRRTCPDEEDWARGFVVLRVKVLAGVISCRFSFAPDRGWYGNCRGSNVATNWIGITAQAGGGGEARSVTID